MSDEESSRVKLVLIVESARRRKINSKELVNIAWIAETVSAKVRSFESRKKGPRDRKKAKAKE